MATAPDYVRAAMLGGLLSSAGIPYFEKRAGLDFPTSPSNMRSIMVPKRYAGEARELLGRVSDYVD